MKVSNFFYVAWTIALWSIGIWLVTSITSCEKEEPQVQTIIQTPTHPHSLDFDMIEAIGWDRNGITPAKFYSSGSGTISNAFVSKNKEESAINLNFVDSTTYTKTSPGYAVVSNVLSIANFDIVFHYSNGFKDTLFNHLSKYYGKDSHTDYKRIGLLHVFHPASMVSFEMTKDFVEYTLPYRGTLVRQRVWVTRFHKSLRDRGEIVTTKDKEPENKNGNNFTLNHYF